MGILIMIRMISLLSLINLLMVSVLHVRGCVCLCLFLPLFLFFSLSFLLSLLFPCNLFLEDPGHLPTSFPQFIFY